MSSNSNNSSPSSSSTPRYFRLITIALLFTLLLFIIIQFIGKQGKLEPVSSASKTQQISTDTTKNQQQVRVQEEKDESKCLTFDERYNFCIKLKKTKPNPLDRKQYLEEHFLFSSSSTRHQHEKEVALLRMHRRKNWREEFWLSVCTFLVEASEEGKRDAFLYTIDGHEDSIPIEFQSFVKIHPETELHKTFSEENSKKYNVLKYTGGYHRGDLAAALFLQRNPHHQYDFAWVIESDVRFVGSSWKYLFGTSRRVARNEPDVLDENDEKSSSSKGKDAHFIFYSPRVLFFGYDIAEALRPIIFPKIINKNNKNITLFNVNAVLNFLAHAYQEVRDGKPIPKNPSRETILNYDAITEREKFHGKNFSTALENRVWYQAFAPAFGMSRTLAKKIYENAMNGEGWGNQEIDLPVTAILNNLKSVSLAPQFRDNTISTQFYFSWQRKAPLMREKWFRKSEKDGESAPLYTSWMALRDDEMKNNDTDENRGSSSTKNPAKAIVTPKMLEELTENGFPEAVCRYWSFGVSPRFKGKKCLRNVLFHPVKY